LKVVQIHNKYRFDGGENVMYESVIRLLRKEGHEVCVFERSSKEIEGLTRKMHALTEGVFSISARKAVALLLAAERPDVVHVHNLYPLISPSVLVACREAQVPVVMSCPNYRLTCPISYHLRKGAICELCCGGREYWCVLKNCRDSVPESFGYALRNAVARKWRLFSDNVTLYVPPTEFVKRRAVDAGLPAQRIVVVPNMISTPSGTDALGEGDYIAYAGRISPEKGIATLLASVQLTGLPVRLAGDYSGMPEIVKNASASAKFIGHLNRNQLDGFYRNARFLVVPSVWFEPFGLVVAEAMSRGLPVIASRIGGLPEIIEDGVTGLLFEPGNADDLAEKMKLLWRSPNMCRQMGMAGREKAIREYSEDVYYKRLMVVYKRAIQVNKEIDKCGRRTTIDNIM
jgi:glycosyltransferase involved in cell wall biosynthesis